MNRVFISQSEVDRRSVDALRAALNAAGIATWVSYADIEPGAHWDEVIDKALRESAAVLVVASHSSVKSRYVRAEISLALDLSKTVIPVVLGKVDLPVRWTTLQHLKWDGSKPERIASAIARTLPHSSLTDLRGLLDKRSGESEIQETLRRHPEWLPIEFHMASAYSYRRLVSAVPGSVIDCFAARMDSRGPRSYLYYLGSPFLKPISSAGAISQPLKSLISRVRADIARLGEPLPRKHPLSPHEVLRHERRHWRHLGDFYADVRAYVVVGRRNHFGSKENVIREQISGPESRFISDKGRLEILSYDRVVDQSHEPTFDRRWP